MISGWVTRAMKFVPTTAMVLPERVLSRGACSMGFTAERGTGDTTENPASFVAGLAVAPGVAAPSLQLSSQTIRTD